MKSLLLGLVAVVLAGPMNGCGIFGPDQSVVLDVESIDAPTTVGSGSRLTAVLTVVTGGCRRFDHIETRRSASGATVTVWGRDGSKGRPGVGCTTDIRFEPHSVAFDPPFAGTFDIVVERPRTEPLRARVQVQ